MFCSDGIEFIAEIPQRPKPTPEVINIDGMCTREQIGKVKLEPKLEPGTSTPIPGTSTINASELERMRAQIEKLSNLLHQRLDKHAFGDGEGKTTVPKKEPEEVEPAPGDTERAPETADPQSDTDEVIQNLEDHIATMQEAPQNTEPQPPQESADDSGTEVPAIHESNNDSEEDHPGIENVASSSQEEEIVVDPSNIGDPNEAPEIGEK